jgi:hypothetical protein
MATSFPEFKSTRWHKGEVWHLHAVAGACEFHPYNAVTLLEIALRESLKAVQLRMSKRGRKLQLRLLGA